MPQTQLPVQTRAVLVSVALPNQSEREIEVSLAELERLLHTAGGEAEVKLIQNKVTPDPRTYLGSGKVRELAEICKNLNLELVIFDCELSPAQIRNLEEDLPEHVRVIDRSMLILDIFALHAATSEGKLQVELAQLQYTVPRLIGSGNVLSRLGGGIGTRGPGESKLEQDKRHLHRRMYALQEELAQLEQNRAVTRKQRERSGLKRIAIAGYTNAGKSTLLNALTDAGILAQDLLFATLDPTTRKLSLPSGTEVLLTDTVGFIRNLPHHLISAFKSTLDEVCFADILLVLCDASDPEWEAQLGVTCDLLQELGAQEKPTLYVLNKCDLCPQALPHFAGLSPENVLFLSAKTKQGIGNLLARLDALVHAGTTEETFLIPNEKAGVLSALYKEAQVVEVVYGDTSITVRAIVDEKAKGMFRTYCTSLPKEEKPEWED